MTVKEFADSMLRETGKIILGKAKQAELITLAILADGHVLLDDIPGTGKTTLIKSFAHASGCRAGRIQFVPDLMPADITGMSIYDRRENDFRLVKGPVFCNILLADEINRAIPRTQSALLEAMEEKHVTIDSQTLPLPVPFIVLATQNPVESESTFALPAAQLDRFLIRLTLGYPDAENEKKMLENDGITPENTAVISSPEDICILRKEVNNVTVSEAVTEYIVALVSATRNVPGVKLGAGPRATKALFRASKALAAMHGRSFVTPDDVQYLTPYVLEHRLVLSAEMKLSGKTAKDVTGSILKNTPVPPERTRLFDI